MFDGPTRRYGTVCLMMSIRYRAYFGGENVHDYSCNIGRRSSFTSSTFYYPGQQVNALRQDIANNNTVIQTADDFKLGLAVPLSGLSKFFTAPRSKTLTRYDKLLP